MYSNAAHFIRPVIHRFFVVDFFPKAADYRTGGPHLTSRLLLRQHCIENRHQPILELAIIVVRHNEISNPVQTSPTEVCAVKVPVSKVCLAEAFYKVFFNPACSRHNCRDMSVLHQIQKDFAESGRNEIRSISEENTTSSLFPDLRIPILIVLVLFKRLVRESPSTLLLFSKIYI